MILSNISLKVFRNFQPVSPDGMYFFAFRTLGFGHFKFPGSNVSYNLGEMAKSQRPGCYNLRFFWELPIRFVPFVIKSREKVNKIKLEKLFSFVVQNVKLFIGEEFPITSSTTSTTCSPNSKTSFLRQK